MSVLFNVLGELLEDITEVFFSGMCNEQHGQHCQGDRDIVMMQLIGST